MELVEIKQFVESKFKKPLPSCIFLDNMRVVDEDFRKTFAYNDFTHVPFYYWLGRILKVDHLLEIGFRLGLLSGNFLKSCQTVKKFLAFQEVVKNEYYSMRLGRANIRDVYKRKFYVHVGSMEDDLFEIRFQSTKFDLVIINEETHYDKHRFYFDMIWPQLSQGGFIIMDYLKKHKATKAAFKDFCMSKNVKPELINTTYGVGLIKKG